MLEGEESPAARRPFAGGAEGLSPLGWGMWRFKGEDVNAAHALIEAALEIGVNLFDTADVYGPDNGEPFGAAEALLGRVFARAPGLRQRMTLATKGGIELGAPYNSSRAYLTTACEASLRRLRCERIDLYQIHRPDLLTHPHDAAETLAALRASGKIGEVGVSNFTPAQTTALARYLPFPLASVQPEFSPLALHALEDGALDQAMEHGWAVLAWSPLAGGRLLSENTAQAVAVRAALAPIAARHDASISAAAYAWIMAHPARPIPIIGSQQVARIREAQRALEIRFTRPEWYHVLIAARQKPLP